MQEFDQSGGFGSGSTSNATHTAPGSSSTQDYTYAPPYGAGRTTDPSWSAGQPRTNTYAYAPVPAAPPVPPTSRPDTHTRTPSPPAVRGYDLSDHTDNEERLDPPTSTPLPKENATGGFGIERDTGATRASVSAESPTSPADQFPGAFPILRGPAPISQSSQRPSSGSGLGPVPISGLVQAPSSQTTVGPTSRSTVDFTKLGLLPKRPVSLVRPQSPPTAGSGSNTHVQKKRESNADELEYVENPFEDRR